MNRVIQGNLLKIAAGFLILQTLIITLSPAVRARTWDVDFRWSQWVVLVVWGLIAYRSHQSINRHLPDADPYLFPVAALLSGWGLLTVWRLDSNFGARQALWLGISALVFIAGLQLPGTLEFHTQVQIYPSQRRINPDCLYSIPGDKPGWVWTAPLAGMLRGVFSAFRAS